MMQCATCHDVHNNTTYKPFLRDNTAGSLLCLDCHGA
jgi:predicted CXXCH cytochrome family protein